MSRRTLHTQSTRIRTLTKDLSVLGHHLDVVGTPD